MDRQEQLLRKLVEQQYDQSNRLGEMRGLFRKLLKLLKEDSK